MAEVIDKDKRNGYTYDVIIKQLDSAFWRTETGTPTISSNKIRLTSARISSFVQHLYGDYEIALNIPTTPSSGEAKTWGLRLPGTDSLGAIYFEIAGAVFTCVSIDDGGTSETTTLTWNSYEGSETKFRFTWEPGRIQFLIDGVVVATHTVRVGTNALPWRIDNSNDSDSTDLGLVIVRRAAAIV